MFTSKADSPPRTSPYKTHNNIHILKGLFYETATETNRDYVLYTLKPEDHTASRVAGGELETFPSIHRLYVEANDPLEYSFAKKYFASWKHWLMIKRCTWFLENYDEMKDELEVSIQSKALFALREQGGNEKNAVQVNRFLLDRGWINKNDLRGRPNKETIKKEADKLFREKDDIGLDYTRILNG